MGTTSVPAKSWTARALPLPRMRYTMALGALPTYNAPPGPRVRERRCFSPDDQYTVDFPLAVILNSFPLGPVAAISVGIVHNYSMLDLCYDEDFGAGVDFNVVMTSKGEFVEVQGTAEGKPFSRETIDSLLSLAEKGIRQLFEIQQDTLSQLKTGKTP